MPYPQTQSAIRPPIARAMGLTLLTTLVTLLSTATTPAHAQFLGTRRANAKLPTRKVQFTNTIQFKVAPGQKNIRLIHLIPQSIAHRQTVHHLHFSHNPIRQFSVNGVRYAEFNFPSPVADFAVLITASLTLHQYDLNTAMRTKRAKKLPKTDDPALFRASERYIEAKNPTIQSISNPLKHADTLKSIRAAFDFTIKTLAYKGYNPDDLGALKALKSRSGDCSEFSDLLVAILRANNISARVAEGYTTYWKKGDTHKHSWVEAYHPKLGWIPLDPLHTKTGSSTFKTLKNNYIYLSHTRNDKTLNLYHTYAYWYRGRPPTVSASFKITDIK